MEISKVLCCISCKSNLQKKKSRLYCKKCRLSFPVEGGIFDFNKEDDSFVEEYQDFTKESDSYGFSTAPMIIIEGHKRKMEILSDIFKRYDLKDKKVLDVGAGEHIPDFLKGCKTGMIQDISKNVLKRSRKNSNSSEADKFIFVASNQDLPCFSESIDVVFAGEIIEHVKDPIKLINEMYRVLKPGGKLVLTTPNKKAAVFRSLGFEFSRHPQHISLQDYSSLVDILRRKFKVKRVYGFNQSFFHYVDRLVVSSSISRWWASRFFKRPQYATNLIVECEK